MIQATDSIYCLASALAFTQNPHLVRDTILDGGWCWNLSRDAKRMRRQDIDLPYHIAVPAETTLPAGIDPAAWFMPMTATRTCLAGVVLVLQDDGNAFRLRFVLHKGTHLAMVPLARALVVHFALVYAVCNGADVAINDGLCLTVDRFSNNGAAYLMFDIAHNQIVLRLATGFRVHQLSLATAPVFLARQGFAERLEVLGMPPLDSAAFSTGDNRSTVGVPDHGRMHLASIDADGIGAQRYPRLLAVLKNDVPGVASGLSLEDQAHFDKALYIVQCLGKGKHNLAVSEARRQLQRPGLPLDARIFPDGGTKLFSTPGEMGFRESCFPECSGGLARLEKALLCRINGVGVHRHIPRRPAHVAQLRKRLFREPHAVVFEDAPVTRDDAAVDTPTVQVQRITGRAWQFAWQHVGTYHLDAFLCRNVALDDFRGNISSRAGKITARPQGWKTAQNGILLPEVMRRKPFALLHDFCRRVPRPHAHKEMDMVWLNGQLKNRPPFLSAFLLNECLAILDDSSTEYGFAALRTPDEMVDNEVDTVFVSLVFHVVIIAFINHYINIKWRCPRRVVV